MCYEINNKKKNDNKKNNTVYNEPSEDLKLVEYEREEEYYVEVKKNE